MCLMVISEPHNFKNNNRKFHQITKFPLKLFKYAALEGMSYIV